MIHPVHPKYGERHQCYKCGCKFYDLARKVKICPRCGADQVDAPSPDDKLFQSRFVKEEEDILTPDTFADSSFDVAEEEIEDSEDLEVADDAEPLDGIEGEDDEEI